MTLRVLTLSTLFPDATRPNFGVFVERQTCALASRPDVDVTVLAPLGLPPWPLSLHAVYRARRALPAEEQWQGLTVHRPRFPIIPAIGGRWHPPLMTRAILPLVRRLHATRPFDVIDASFFFPDGPVARRLSRQLGIPYSVKARGADIHHWGRDPATAAMVREAGRDAAGLLAVSEAMKADMVALGMEPARIRVHYTGVDQARFRLADRASAKAAHGLCGPVVTVLGALIPRKGQALVIEALARLADVTLLLIGDGPDRTGLSALAGRLGMAARVRFLGSVPHGDLPGWLAASDIMALPSASEGLANAWVEALACGVPLVISEAGGARELLDRPEAGRIVPREPEAIQKAIASLLATPPDPAAVRATAERFSWDANGAALEVHLRACAGKTAGE
ncbi:glycosyltransferase [Sphingobium lignivorans]|uniref:Glycosyltransferase involved in cell wall biosynthesis n=1 Tax=Sphingobium lignivorans TaxID=2735886 RepID=A0ABR6NI90_9SPHN|nr:glycosyltransferase [Sphingobium lignivorans]MBB5987004.1 glycosyltransferase involved in cell wall biosynthesis [Sphingobium lignivorans]